MALKPLTISPDLFEQLAGQLSTQTGSNQTPRSEDPVNYPVFAYENGKSYLMYIPNHTVLIDGVDHLVADKPWLHNVTTGTRFAQYRCTEGLSLPGYEDKSCPACEAVGTCFELANLRITDDLKRHGLQDDGSDEAKKIRKDNFQKNVVESKRGVTTIPVWIIETAPGKTKQPASDDIPSVSKLYWLNISESQMDLKWAPALEAFEDEPDSLAGQFFVVSYPGDNRRDAARNMTIAGLQATNLQAAKPALDQASAGWTPAKSIEMVIANHFYAFEDFEKVVETAMEETRRSLTLFDARKPSTDVAANFGNVDLTGAIPDAAAAAAAEAGIAASAIIPDDAADAPAAVAAAPAVDASEPDFDK